MKKPSLLITTIVLLCFSCTKTSISPKQFECDPLAYKLKIDHYDCSYGMEPETCTSYTCLFSKVIFYSSSPTMQGDTIEWKSINIDIDGELGEVKKILYVNDPPQCKEETGTFTYIFRSAQEQPFYMNIELEDGSSKIVSDVLQTDSNSNCITIDITQF